MDMQKYLFELDTSNHHLQVTYYEEVTYDMVNMLTWHELLWSKWKDTTHHKHNLLTYFGRIYAT